MAVLGSIATATYHDNLRLTGVPAAVAEPIRNSVASAAHIGGQLADQAISAFVDGVHATLLAAAAIVLTTSAVVGSSCDSALPRTIPHERHQQHDAEKRSVWTRQAGCDMPTSGAVHAHPDPAVAGRRSVDAHVAWLVEPRARPGRVRVNGGQPAGLSSPADLASRASRAVIGERFWNERASVAIPERHRVAPKLLIGVNSAGAPFVVWGLWATDVWIVLFGLAVQSIGKAWFLDRMVWLHDDVVTAAAQRVNP